jgi:predicted metal-binding membrane protein
MASERASQQAFFGVSALLFAASAALTIVWCASMSPMDGMPMSHASCTRPAHGAGLAEAPDSVAAASVSVSAATGLRRGSLRHGSVSEGWPGAAASFLGMWVVMMVAMMLPSLVPMLWRYREAVGRKGQMRLGRLTALVGVGYFFVWTAFGMAAFPLGVALAAIEVQQPALAGAVPIAIGVVVLAAGALQFTAWKARCLACCREASGFARAGVSASYGETSPNRPPAAEAGPGRGRMLPADAGTAWRHGLRLGVHCSQCCGGLMAVLLVVGVMDLRAMAVVTAAITAERLAPAGERVARAIGVVVVAAGVFLIARAAGLG